MIVGEQFLIFRGKLILGTAFDSRECPIVYGSITLRERKNVACP